MTIAIIFISVLGLVALLCGFLFLKRRRQVRRMVHKKLRRIAQLQEWLETGRELDSHDVLPFATNPATRLLTYDLLLNFDKKHLFPQTLYTRVKAAESQLGNWLEFPTELDTFPDEMEHLQTATIDLDGNGRQPVQYEVFRFRIRAPHWAADKDWMLGVTGPYFPGADPYGHAPATFSRLTQQDDGVSPDEEVRWVHDNIYTQAN